MDEKEAEGKQALIIIENQIKDILVANLIGFFSPGERCRLLNVENKKEEGLKKEEEAWRLKSMAIWIEVGIQIQHFS